MLAAAAVGLILAGPNFAFISNAENGYQGLPISAIDNDQFYLARISAVMAGDFSATTATLAGVPQAPFSNPPGGEAAVALLGRFLRLDLGNLVILSNFLFPFFLTLLLYALAYQLSRSRLAGATAAIGVLLASNLFFSSSNLKALFFDPSALWHNVYNRPVHPQVSSVIFFAWLLLLYFWQKHPRPLTLIFSGLLFGAMFYIYPYSWLLAGAILGWLLVFSLISKNFRQAGGVVWMLFIGFAVAIGYLHNQWQLTHNFLYETLKQRFVLYPSHEAVWSNLAFGSLVFCGLFFWRSRRILESTFMLAISLALWTVLNQQAITGLKLFPGHWHWYYVTPVFIVFGVLAVWEIFKNKRALALSLVGLATLIFLADGALTARSYYRNELPGAKILQRYGPVYVWLSANTPPGSVVLADPWFSTWLPAYSRDLRYIYLPTDELYLVPTDRLKDTFFTRLRMQGANADNIENYINQDTPELKELLFGYYRRYTQNCEQCYAPEEIIRMRSDYLDFLRKDFGQELKKYRLDYIAVDTQAEGFKNVPSLPNADFITEINGVKIYKAR